LTILLSREYHLKFGRQHIRSKGKAVRPGVPMDKKRLEQFKKRLETRQQELRRLVSRNVQDGRAADEQAAQDIADKAANSYTKEFLFHQSNNDRQLLQLVEEALNRIREGSYGECVNCGNELNAKRLEAVPWTRYCINCQEKVEQGLLEESSI
jgi:DnaK suppressor protein